jgi:hypothetical protein
MISITQENLIEGPRFKLIKHTRLENKAPTAEGPEMAQSRCSPMHELKARLVQEGPKKIWSPTSQAVFTASAQYLFEVLCSPSIVRAISQTE